ncbi:MAG: NYN domain-containing protein [Clostridia bacterium]|nr:NYN domain-containing protein [Clostridia bacterium]
MEYLLVDGYNIINAWKDVFHLESESLEDCRDRLVSILSNYQGYKKIRVIVVFDAHWVKGGREKEEVFDNLKIVFTKENESADNYIEKFVYKFGTTYTIRVATSDYLEQTMILSSGGIRMSPRELREEVGAAGRDTKIESKIKTVGKTNTIMSNMKPDVFEKLDKMRRGKF